MIMTEDPYIISIEKAFHDEDKPELDNIKVPFKDLSKPVIEIH